MPGGGATGLREPTVSARCTRAGPGREPGSLEGPALDGQASLETWGRHYWQGQAAGSPEELRAGGLDGNTA